MYVSSWYLLEFLPIERIQSVNLQNYLKTGVISLDTNAFYHSSAYIIIFTISLLDGDTENHVLADVGLETLRNPKLKF